MRKHEFYFFKLNLTHEGNQITLKLTMYEF